MAETLIQCMIANVSVDYDTECQDVMCEYKQTTLLLRKILLQTLLC